LEQHKRIIQRVINISGGKTSAYMTIKEYKEGDIVMFSDTGREHPKTYKFLNDFEAHENIPIVRVGGKGAFEKYLSKRDFEELPNRVKRSCTIELKIKPARRYLRSLGLMKYENLIGFRADEPQRVKNAVQRWKQVVTTYPLYEKGINKAMVNAYWETKPYNLEIPSILGNCTLCFMKGQNAIMAILRDFPELADEWIEDERKSAKHYGHTYLNGVTIEQLRDRAQNNLFKGYDLGEMNPAFNCACTT
jgi:hypothetical protein